MDDVLPRPTADAQLELLRRINNQDGGDEQYDHAKDRQRARLSDKSRQVLHHLGRAFWQ